VTEPITPDAVQPGPPGPPGRPDPQQSTPAAAGAVPGAAPAAPWSVPQQWYPAGYAPPPPGYQVPPGYEPLPGYQVPPPGYQVPPGYGLPPGYQVPPGYYPPPGAYPPGYFPGVAVQPPVLVGGMPLASFMDRFLGNLIDGLIKFAIFGVPAGIAVYFLVLRDLFRDVTSTPPGVVADLGPLLRKELLALLIIWVSGLIVSYVYDVLLMHRTGQTPGKRMVKTRVVRVDGDGPVTVGIATRRWFAAIACGYVPGLVYVDCLWLLWDKPYQQCLHDKFARTTVVKVDQATAATTA